MDDWQLLQDYVGRNSETAFRELVNRYINFVHSAAHRQVQNGPLAEEVTQAVFILLARKAREFRRDVILSGWLFRTTRFVAARAVRTEQRRQRREQEAYEMQQLTHPDENWKRIAPVLDEALDNLGATDRDAVLLRFFNDKSFRETGTSLGVSEDAAKKRVTRALEKLRTFFSKRGVTLSATVLASSLSAHSVNAAPAPLALAVATKAIEGGSIAAGSLPTLAGEVLNAWHWANLKLAGTSIAAGIITVSLFVAFVSSKQTDSKADMNLSVNVISNSTHGSAEPTTEILVAGATVPASTQGTFLTLRVVAADTGEPVARARLSMNTVVGSKWEQRYDLMTDTAGICRVPYSKNTGRLDIGVLSTGWGARFATWVTSRNPIPDEYTLRVERLTNSIGGWLRDETGQPVANAEILVSFSGTGDASARETPRERIGSAMGYAPVAKTDFQGRWICAVIPSKHDGFHVQASHSEFRKTSIASSSSQESISEIKDEKLKQLWNGTLVTVMDRGFTLAGRVIDEFGNPISNAKITKGIQQEIFKTDYDGWFAIPKREKGEWEFTVSAQGYAPLRQKVEISADMEPTVIQLKPGAVFRFRVVDGKDVAVPKATVGLQSWGEIGQVLEWSAQSDSDGRIEWRSAPPDAMLEFYAKKNGFCYTRNVLLEADGEEHTIELRRTLTVTGTAVDSETGILIPQIKSFPGYGDNDWERSETRHNTNGNFKVTFSENKLPWRVRVEAEGYEPGISEPLPEDLTGALEIRLQRLNPDDEIRGVVLHPNGSPLVGAQVALLTPEHSVTLDRGRLAFRSSSGQLIVKTDSEGSFSFQPTHGVNSIVAVDESGFGRVRALDFRQPITIQLRPWGRIEGVVTERVRRKPVEGIWLEDPLAWKDKGRMYLGNDVSRAKLDADGKFVLELVPPMDFFVWLNPGGLGVPFHHRTPVAVSPGKTAHVVIDKKGPILRGNFATSTEKVNWSSQRVWLEYSDSTGQSRSINLKINSDGTFISEDEIPPGDYRLRGSVLGTILDSAVSIPFDSADQAEVKLETISIVVN